MHCERKSYLLHHSQIGSQQTHPCGVNQLLNLHRPPFLSSCKDRVCELWVGPSSDPKANLPFLHSLCCLYHHRDTNSFSKHTSSLHSFLLFLWSHLCLLLMLHLHLLLFPPSSKRIPKNPGQISCWCRPLTCTSASASASSSAPTTNKTLEEFLPQIQPQKNNNAAATHPLANSPKCRCGSSEILTTKSNNQQNNHLKTSTNTNKNHFSSSQFLRSSCLFNYN